MLFICSSFPSVRIKVAYLYEFILFISSYITQLHDTHFFNKMCCYIVTLFLHNNVNIEFDDNWESVIQNKLFGKL